MDWLPARPSANASQPRSWDRMITMKKPSIDLSECTLCGTCIDVCPDVFRMNAAGFVEVIERKTYPEEEVNEAIKYCPEDCIYWEATD